MVCSIQHFEGYLDRQVVQITPVQNSWVCVIQRRILHSRIVGPETNESYHIFKTNQRSFSKESLQTYYLIAFMRKYPPCLRNISCCLRKGKIWRTFSLVKGKPANSE